MLTFHLDYEGFEAATVRFADMAYRAFDLRPLAVRIAEILVAQNRDLRTAGLDQYAVPFVDLAPSTMKKRVRQGRMGPPLAPDGSSSPIVTGFQVDTLVNYPDDIVLTGHWPGVPWVGYHVDNQGPRGHLPVRDPAGIPASAQGEIVDAFEEFLAGLVAQTF